jgi:uncharacterized iron-regulated protein
MRRVPERRMIPVAFPRFQRAALLLCACVLAGCTAFAPRYDWEDRLRGNAVVLLGEVHDNAEQHRLRLAVLRRAFAAGWRPAIAMEQFDRERQPDIERARRERPDDARHVIALAASPTSAPGRGWNWDYYRPFVELALEYDAPLLAANLSNADTGKVARGGYGAVFSAETVAALGLNAAIPPALQAAQEREIDAGHCHALPQSAWPAMARAQYARDAVMAAVLREHAALGVVLLEGNGHVRRDIAVPWWLGTAQRARAFSVGFLEGSSAESRVEYFDAVVWTVAAQRPDPCAELAKRSARP